PHPTPGSSRPPGQHAQVAGPRATAGTVKTAHMPRSTTRPPGLGLVRGRPSVYPGDIAHSRLGRKGPMHRSMIWARPFAARPAWRDGSAGMAAAVVIAVVLAACVAQPIHRAAHHGGRHAVLASTARTAAEHLLAQPRSVSLTTRTFRLGAGRATRTFTFREQGGVILLNQLTVRHGVRAFVKARIPHLAGAEV